MNLKLSDWRAEIGFNSAGVTTINLYAVAGFVGNIQMAVLYATRAVARECKRRFNTKAFARGAVVFPGLDVDAERACRVCEDLGIVTAGGRR